MKARWMWLAIAIAIASAAFNVCAAVTRSSETNALRAQAERLKEFCTGTRMTLDVDIRKLEGTDPRWNQYATDWIAADVARHGFTSVYACLGERTPSGLGDDPLPRARAWRDELVRNGY